MAITYKGGNRLLGLSSDAKPVNLDSGSTFIETDTGKEHTLQYGSWIETNKPSGSVLELLDDYSQIRPKRFWHWFSGSALTSDWLWTLQNHSGTGTVVMDDNAGDRWGGILFRTAASADANSSIDFNNKRQYDQTNCVFICVGRRYDSSTRASWGMTNTAARTANFADCVDDTANTNKSLRSADGSTISETEGSITITATPMSCMKLELSATNINMYIDGVLDVTKTTNRPAAKLQPSLDVLTRDSSTNGSLTRFIEAYNT